MAGGEPTNPEVQRDAILSPIFEHEQTDRTDYLQALSVAEQPQSEGRGIPPRRFGTRGLRRHGRSHGRLQCGRTTNDARRAARSRACPGL